MATDDPISYETVLKIVSSWPVDQRLILMRDILDTVIPLLETPRPRQGTLHLALGLRATDQPPPTDEEVEQWLEEERMKKYGGGA